MTRTPNSRQRRQRFTRSRQLVLEPLEDRRLLAAVITVNSTGDADTRDNSLTLREAILINNRTLAVGTLTAAEQAQVVGAPTSADADTINVPAGTYTLTIAGQNEDAAATGDLDITEDLNIVGAGQATTIIQAGTQGPGNNGSANGIDRVFDIRDANIEIVTDVSISGVTIRHGRGSQGGGINMDSRGTLAVNSSAIVNNAPTGQGGGLNNNVNGTVTITSSLVSGNVTTGQGGGINNNSGGSLTLTSSTVSNNQSGSRGGGINNNSTGTLIVNQSTISGNTAVGITAGGIHNNSSGSAAITASTISGNSAAGSFSAGGLHNNSSGSVTVTNTTISGNSATGDRSAGGVNNNSNGTITALNVTIANNTVSGPSNIASSIYINSSGQVRLKNTLISDNSAIPNCVGNPNLPTSQGNNLDTDGTCGLNSTPGDGDLFNVSANLGALADNGGPALTHLLLAGSPAINAGNNQGAPATDQRGISRPQPAGGTVDIGAVEVQLATAPDLTATKSNNVSGTTIVGSPWTWTIHVANEGGAAATFSSGQTIFSDNLPNSNVTYGPVNVINSAGISGTGSISCSINPGSNLTCTAVGGSVILGTIAGNPNPFTLVATATGAAQLFGFASDAQGRIYIGNNSNNTAGIPVKRFDPALFSGTPIVLQDFGPAVGDADGIAFGNGFIYTGDQNEGLRRTAVTTAASNILVAGAAINGTGSPIVVRPSDGHIFVGFGSTVAGALGAKRIDEYDALGSFVQTFTTVAETETMAFDPLSGLIYYAPFGTEVRAFNPLTEVDTHVGDASGFIDGGLAFDPVSGLIFVGTANGPNSGRVETIDPSTGVTRPFAAGFDGSLGILREPVSGDLYFLTSSQLFRLNSNQVFPGSFDIRFTATASTPGTFANPRFDSSATVDPNNNVIEGNESNNSASDTVTVTATVCSLIVNTTQDVVSAGDSVNSLREAIICANTTPGANTINVPAGTYTLTIAGTQEDEAATGDLDITDDLTLSGAAAATTIIQAGPTPGSGIDRVFHVVGGGPDVSMSGLTIRHGLESSSNPIGGGILNENNLTLTNVIVTQNQAQRGAGIYHSAEGTLTLTRSTVSANQGDKGGGILNNAGAVVITDSTISGNIATTQGGGLLNTGDSMSLVRSTVSGNEAGSGGGGGIFNRAPLTAINSTISGNTADGSGGGISNTGGGFLDLFHVTIANNTADADSDETGDGGGVFAPSDTGDTADLQSTIVANNIDTGGEAPDISGIVNSLGFNLIENTTGTTITGTTIGNILGLDPVLGPLANNGGPTQTHALLPDSPAIDAADSEDFPETDQRGVTRPLGEGPDIGAFEATPVGTGLPVCSVLTFNDPLEPRSARIVPDQDNSGRTVLIVTGTDGHDVIVVEPRPTNKSQIRVRFNGDLLGIFSKSAVRRIVAFGLDGHDVIVVNATLTQPAVLLGGNGIDQLFGAKGIDGVDGGSGDDHLFGGSANDTICGGIGDDFLYGQAGNDFLGGDAGRDRLFGEAGNDHLQGNVGPDFLYGGLGNDRLFGQTGHDQLFGEAGNDIIVGGSGDDRLFGSVGRDVLIGGDGTDLLFGEAHDDIHIAGSTAHDENETALTAILAEWTSRRKYNQRVNLIRSDGGANGVFVLNTATVNDDGLEDNLWGDGDLDWFLFGSEDRLRDKSGSELIN